MAQLTNQKLAMDFASDPNTLVSLAYVENIDMFAWYNDSMSYFELLDKKRMTSMVYKYMIDKMTKSFTMSTVEDIVKQLKIITNITYETNITPFIGLQEGHVLFTENMKVEFGGRNKPAFHYVTLAKEAMEKETYEAPVFFQFLDDVIVDEKNEPDKQLQAFIQEMMGYMLSSTVEAHASFFLVGGGSNGKSVLLSVIREMVGHEFCSSKTIEALTNNQFAAADLVGKKVNICNEEESKFVKSDKFKSLVSGDYISVNRKYENAFEWKPTVTYIFSTNEMPTFGGFNKGLLRRIHVVHMNRFIDASKADPQLFNKIKKEIPEITAWALQGLKRLVENGYKLTKVESMKRTKEHFEGEQSSAVLFFREMYTLDDDTGELLTKDMMYEEYVAWCSKRGKKPLNFYNFHKDILVVNQIDYDTTNGEESIRVRRKKSDHRYQF